MNKSLEIQHQETSSAVPIPLSTHTNFLRGCVNTKLGIISAETSSKSLLNPSSAAAENPQTPQPLPAIENRKKAAGRKL